MSLDAQEPDQEEPEDWDPPINLETAWSVWTLLRSTGWKHLPNDGGLLQQDELLMRDVAIIEWLSSMVEPFVKENYLRRSE